ncbi:hypothetical protein A176_000121 [Myxococcus hansupus]|uniref:SbsA Ig-like domain-containing protein n=1 Tax=Pseudomyxococcus hansupus TaxID=1297742 RepID=A0A0H4WKE9_9BACT|nr:hypothetical protein [Myxococcus hansupus]AKQ63209.1 hypothetical protein A176_000121 [Myxococcus hansupus]
MFRCLAASFARTTLLFTTLSLLGCGEVSDGSSRNPPLPPRMVLNDARGEEYVNGNLLVTVRFQGSTPDKVELLHDGELLATLVPPFQFTWDTRGQEERVHRLQARTEWEGRDVLSEELLVSVDRTRPDVAHLVPRHDNHTFVEASTFRVTFTEPIHVTEPDALKFEYTVHGETWRATLELSEDKRSLSAPIMMRPPGLMQPLDGASSLSLEGITDLAGNPFRENVFTGPLDAWTWTVPAYKRELVSMGRAAGRPAVAMDAEHSAVVAIADASLVPLSLPASFGDWMVVHRQSGETWSRMGNPFPLGIQVQVSNPSLALDSEGNPMVAFLQRIWGQSRRTLEVYRWTSSEWVPMGSSLNAPDGAEVHDAALVVDSEGRPVVAWGASDGIHVARWEAETWQPLGEVQREGIASEARIVTHAPAISADGSGGIFLAWAEAETSTNRSGLYVRHWIGQSWVPVGGRLLRASDPTVFEAEEPSIATTPDGRPVVVWAERNAFANPLQQEVVVARWSGTSWSPENVTSVCEAVPVSGRRWPVVAVDVQGRELVSFLSGTSSSSDHEICTYLTLYDTPRTRRVRRVGAYSGPVAMTLDETDMPVLVWGGASFVSMGRLNWEGE